MSSKKPVNMTLEEIEAELGTVQGKLEGLWKEQAALQKKTARHANRKQALLDAQAEKLANEGKADWPYLLTVDNGAAKHKILDARLADLGIEASGYFVDTMQYALRIAMHREQEGQAEQVTEGLLKVLPFVTPRTEKKVEGLKMVDIFEHTLSQHEAYWLTANEDMTKFAAISGSWRMQTHIESADLLEVVKYIQKNFWYESEYSRDCDDEIECY